jgi:hypothetical protein
MTDPVLQKRTMKQQNETLIGSSRHGKKLINHVEPNETTLKTGFSPCSKAGRLLPSGQRSSQVSNVVSPGFIPTS